VGSADWRLRSPADLWLTRRGPGAAGPPAADRAAAMAARRMPGDGLPRPAHPRRGEFGVVAELLGDPLGAAPGAELTEGRGGGPPDLRGAGLPGSLQRWHEQRIRPCRPDAEVVPGGRHRGPPRRLGPFSCLTWIRQFPVRPARPAGAAGGRGPPGGSPARTPPRGVAGDLAVAGRDGLGEPAAPGTAAAAR
jgi:hypothetical protein